MKAEKMTYAGTGVDYDSLDPFKRKAQKAGLQTAGNIARLCGGKYREFTPSRGESVYLIETPDSFLAHVEEGLGTKNIVADEMQKLTGGYHYDRAAQCTGAMILNDMATAGASALSLAMHIAVEDSGWFDDEARAQSLIDGWKHTCDLAGCTWGGGETPTLKGIVVPGASLLSGSAMGVIDPKERRIKGDIRSGDSIIMIESSGIHANGLTLARKIAEKLPQGYLTKLSDGRTYGETLLDPTYIYMSLIERCLDAGVPIRYAVNVTGHGWRKLMRSEKRFTYVVHTLPTQLPIFDFIQEHGPVDNREAYGNLNMGAGFALYVPEESVSTVISIAKFGGFRAFVAGFIKDDGEKKVVIQPKDLVFEGDTLAVR